MSRTQMQRGQQRMNAPKEPLVVSIGIALLLSTACRGRTANEASGARADVAAALPLLEDIFLKPPISGEAPSIQELSADGSQLLLSWSPLPERKPERTEDQPHRPELRILAVSGGAAEPGSGVPLEELVPPEEPAAEPAGEASSETAEDSRPGSAREGKVRLARFAPDGLLLAARTHSLWRVDPSARSGARLVFRSPAESSGEDGAETEERGRIQRFSLGPRGEELWIFAGRDLYRVPYPPPAASDVVGPEEGELVSGAIGSDASRLTWSADRKVAFSLEGIEPEEADSEEAAPKDEQAKPHVFHLRDGRGVVLEGLADIEDAEQARLSPDGRFLFAAEVDRSNDPEPTLMPDFLSDRVSTIETRSKLADDRPSPTKLWLWNTETGERTELVLPPLPTASSDDEEEELEDRPWLSSGGWAPQSQGRSSARLLLRRTTEDFRRHELWLWEEGELSQLWGETDSRWVGGPVRGARWSRDGERVFVGSEAYARSTTPGHCQLFVIDAAGGDPRQLTKVSGEISGFRELEGGGLLIQASQEDPARRVILRLSAEAVAGSEPPRAWRYPQPEGWNASAHGSMDGERIVFTHEGLLEPAELWTAGPSGSRALTDTVPRTYRRVEWIRPAKLQVRAQDGTRVHAHVYLPRGLSLGSSTSSASSKSGAGSPSPRATIVFVHGAGYLQNVTDSMTEYPLNAMFHSRLAEMGYVVVDVDYRGSAGYGRDFRTAVQYHLGGKDLGDIHSVLDELSARGLVDAERIGVYGGSYGGFLALMALFTAPERWAAGAALRSVTDWRTYHPGYTQPRLGRPSTHADAYRISSPIDHAGGLEDPLLILHGMQDRNVFAQDSIRLIEKLIDLNRDFDAMLYPSQGHAFEDGPHWLDEYRRIEQHLLEHLGPPLATDTRK